MSAAASTRRKNFFRWAALGREDRVSVLKRAVDALVPPLEEAGFQWIDKSFDCGDVPAHTINLERGGVGDEIDYVLIIFDKYHRARFQIIFGTKEKAPPHQWVRAGALVWKKESGLVKFKWWGARWWHLDKNKTMGQAIDRAAALLPQVVNYLSGGVAQGNIWPSEIGKQLQN